MEVNLLGVLKRAMICRFNERGFQTNVMITPITEDQEITLDRSKSIYLEGVGSINRDDAFFYGEVDLNNQTDINEINRNNFFMKDGTGMIPITFNYDRACHTLKDVRIDETRSEKQIKHGPCCDPVAWFKYKYCLIGKPQRVIVFRF